MKHVGKEIRQRRTELKRSVDEASVACTIPKELIQALEEGDLEKLPHDCFAAGLLRSYCRYLDLPAEGYVTRLQEARSRVEQAPASSLTVKALRGPRLSFPNLGIRVSKEFQTWLAVCGLLILGWFTYSSVIRPTADVTQSHAQAASIESTAGR